MESILKTQVSKKSIEIELRGWLESSAKKLKSNKFKGSEKATALIILNKFCSLFDSPLARSVQKYLKSGDHLSLVKMDLDPAAYDNKVSFFEDYSILSFFKSLPGLNTGIDTEAVAYEKFFEAERSCQDHNHRLSLLPKIGNYEVRSYIERGPYLRSFLQSPMFFHEDEDYSAEELSLKTPIGGLTVDAVISTAAKRIERILGDIDFDELLSSCRWGPGATFAQKAEDSDVDNKIREERISSTPQAWRWFSNAVCDDMHFLWARGIKATGPCCLVEAEFNLVKGNRFVTVPKNAKTDRGICIEPSANVFLQLGMGKLLRSRLRKVGINLNDQTVNQDLASRAQKQGLATLDLSAASDSISMVLVDRLIPRQWLHFMRITRSPFTLIKGEWKLLNKWSSMGNGYTFELESLIFYSICHAIQELLSDSLTPLDANLKETANVLSVYGDDIIINSCYYSAVTSIFNTIGFKINKDKSFSHGRFFESCGMHYYDGYCVTPLFQREQITTVIEFIRCNNRIIRWYKRYIALVSEKTLEEPLSGETIFETLYRDHLFDSNAQVLSNAFMKQLEWELSDRHSRFMAFISDMWSVCNDSGLCPTLRVVSDNGSDTGYIDYEHFSAPQNSTIFVKKSDRERGFHYGLDIKDVSLHLIDQSAKYAYTIRLRSFKGLENPLQRRIPLKIFGLAKMAQTLDERIRNISFRLRNVEHLKRYNVYGVEVFDPDQFLPVSDFGARPSSDVNAADIVRKGYVIVVNRYYDVGFN